MANLIKLVSILFSIIKAIKWPANRLTSLTNNPTFLFKLTAQYIIFTIEEIRVENEVPMLLKSRGGVDSWRARQIPLCHLHNRCPGRLPRTTQFKASQGLRPFRGQVVWEGYMLVIPSFFLSNHSLWWSTVVLGYFSVVKCCVRVFLKSRVVSIQVSLGDQVLY